MEIERGTQFASFDGRVAGHIEYKRVLSLTDKLFIVEVKTVHGASGCVYT